MTRRASQKRPLVFVSYRWHDTKSDAVRLADDLIKEFGKNRVFIDRRSIEDAERWGPKIESRLSASNVVLALIGEQWLHHLRRPPEDGVDWVRKELVDALSTGTEVIPILVNDARRPSRSEYADHGLEQLDGVQHSKLDLGRYPQDFESICTLLEARGFRRRRPSLWRTIVLTGLATIGLLLGNYARIQIKQANELRRIYSAVDHARKLSRRFPQLLPPYSSRTDEMTSWLSEAEESLSNSGVGGAWNARCAEAPVKARPMLGPDKTRHDRNKEDLKKARTLVKTTTSALLRDFMDAYAERLQLYIETADFLANHGFDDDFRDTELQALASARVEQVDLGWQIGNMRSLQVMSLRAKHRTIDAAKAEWAEAVQYCASTSSPYNGLKITAKEGLLPLGVNAESRLIEFLHWWSHDDSPVQSQRGSTEAHPGQGIILVLMPQSVEVSGTTIPPFLISKYETTQAQWMRMARSAPSAFPAGQRLRTSAGEVIAVTTERWPVDRVSWDESSQLLPWGDLRLPTLTEWRAALGDASEKPANVRDMTFADVLGKSDCDQVRDGYPLFAPVGSFAANRNGLHDMVGNADELVQDRQLDDQRVLVGGSFENVAADCLRNRHITASDRQRTVGLRTAMSLW